MSFKVRRAGLLTTIQDFGRTGHQALGFSPAGFVDYQSAILANQLLGNDLSCAVLEMTLQGISFEVLQDTRIAATGAPMELTINGDKFSIDHSIQLKKGDFVDFGVTKSGLRTYLAVSGGFAVEKILGSYSTHVRSGIGPNDGQPIQTGNVLFHNEESQSDFSGWKVKKVREFPNEIRLVPGPEYHAFTDEAKQMLISQSYQVQNDSDRMGMRLEGNQLHTTSGEHDIISEPTQRGNIQVPKSGQPIILLNDRQTTGGYTRIATVAKVDIPRVAQIGPNQEIKFTMIDVQTASDLYQRKMQDLLKGKYLECDNDYSNFRRLESEKLKKSLLKS